MNIFIPGNIIRYNNEIHKRMYRLVTNDKKIITIVSFPSESFDPEPHYRYEYVTNIFREDLDIE